MERTIQEFATTRGPESARQARYVFSKWIIQQLIRDEVIEANPLAGMGIDLGTNRDDQPRRGARALTEDEYARVLDALLTMNPNSVPAPKRGRYKKSDRAAKRRATIELTALQAATGLRINEARSIRWADITDDGDTMSVTVRPEVSKTHRA